MYKKELFIGLSLVAVMLIVMFLFPFWKGNTIIQRRQAKVTLTNLKEKGDIVPCKIKGFYEAYQDWQVLCKNHPFIANQRINKEVQTALINIGFLCPGYSYPSTKDVNTICDYYCS